MTHFSIERPTVNKTAKHVLKQKHINHTVLFNNRLGADHPHSFSHVPKPLNYTLTPAIHTQLYSTFTELID